MNQKKKKKNYENICDAFPKLKKNSWEIKKRICIEYIKENLLKAAQTLQIKRKVREEK